MLGSMVVAIAAVHAQPSAALARDHGLSQSNRSGRADTEAAKAMKLLESAWSQPYFQDPARLLQELKDSDFDPLRHRPDFQSLAADLAFPTDPFSADVDAAE